MRNRAPYYKPKIDFIAYSQEAFEYLRPADKGEVLRCASRLRRLLANRQPPAYITFDEALGLLWSVGKVMNDCETKDLQKAAK